MTHNVLVAQTLRDFARLRLHEGFLEALQSELDLEAPSLKEALAPAREAITSFKEAAPEILTHADPGVAALMLRPHAEALADVFFAAAYARDIASESDLSRREDETEALAWFCQRHLSRTAPNKDANYATQAARIASIAN